MTETKTYCDHCGKELNAMKDYGNTEIVALTYFNTDLCDGCIRELDNIVLSFCRKKGGETDA